MNAMGPHPHDELHDLLDGRLDGARREGVEAHLRQCTECRREWAALVATRQALRAAVRATEIPSGLATSIGGALDREEARDRAAIGRARPVWWYVAGVGAVAAVLVLAVWPRLLRTETLPAAAARSFAAHRSGDVTLEIRSGDVATLEAFFRARLAFRARVLDLSMMQYALVGGRIGDLSGRATAAFAYRGARSEIVLCQMYPGSLEELPAPVEVREQNGIVFQIYREDGQTLVFWQEGDVTCVLASDMPAEDVIQLAIAKAMRV